MENDEKLDAILHQLELISRLLAIQAFGNIDMGEGVKKLKEYWFYQF